MRGRNIWKKKQDNAGEQPEIEELSDASEHEKELTAKLELQDNAETLRVGLATFSNKLWYQVSTFKDKLKSDMKEKISYLRQRQYTISSQNSNELQTQQISISEAQSHIAVWLEG